MKCSSARIVIDEVANPSSLPFETAAHVESCGSCRQFSREREQLRKLLLEPARVSAPANFELMVARRLAQRNSERRPFWLAGGFYLRLAGTATALACLILVVQVTLLRPAPTSYSTPEQPVITSSATENVPIPSPDHSGPGSDATAAIRKIPRALPVRALTVKHPPLTTDSDRMMTAAISNIVAKPRAILLVRNSGSEHEIAIPMVSVGAQPWVPVSSVYTQEDRSVRAAF